MTTFMIIVRNYSLIFIVILISSIIKYILSETIRSYVYYHVDVFIKKINLHVLIHSPYYIDYYTYLLY